MNTRRPFRIVGIIGLVAIIIAAVGLVTMQLWNALIPTLFGGPVLTYWQAAGLLVLSRIFLAGGGPGRGSRWRHQRWQRRFQQRWESMSPEDREKMRNEWGGRCWWHPGTSDGGGSEHTAVTPS